MQPLAKQLKELMDKRGVSTHALERMAGLKPSAVQNILYGRSKNPNISTLQAIAQALGCPLSDIINENPNISKSHREGLVGERKTEVSAGPWDPDFYMKCFETVNRLLQKEGLVLSKSKVLEIVEEVYIYSSGQGTGRVEEYFAEWLIKRTTNHVPKS